MIGIYKLTSPSGKCYIGQSIDLDRRLRKYKYKGCKEQPLIYNAINKYGWDNFKVDILWCSEDNTNSYFILNQLEEDFINLYDSMNRLKGYNLFYGGNNKSHTDETKLKISEALKKYNRTEQHNDNLKKSRVTNSVNHRLSISNNNSIPILQFSKDGKLLNEYKSATEASKQLNLSNVAICNCLKNKSKSSGGFIWKYKNIYGE